METQLSALPVLGEADVEVSVRIHAPLRVTQFTARQRVNRHLALYCGQSFAVEEPELLLGDPVVWRVPVWVTHPERGPIAEIGALRVDAQTGEVLHTLDQSKLLAAAADGILHALQDDAA